MISLRNFCITALTASCLSFSFVALSYQATNIPKSRKIVCWTDASGQTSCGDTLPVANSGEAHTVLSAKTGLVKENVAKALTEKELVAAEDAKKQAEVQKEVQQKNILEGQMLLSTYDTEDDLNKDFSNRKETLINTMSLTRENLKSMENALRLRLSYLAQQQNEKHKISPAAQDSLTTMQNAIVTQKETLTREKKQVSDLELERQQTLLKYRAAKALTVAHSSTVTNDAH